MVGPPTAEAVTMLPNLDSAQFRALHAVCALYLSETRWVLSASCCAPPSAQVEILQRRDACEAVIGGERTRRGETP